MARKVITPKGEFPSLKSAADALNVSPQTLQLWLKSKPHEYCYADSKPTTEYGTEVDLSDITEFTLKGVTYKVDDLRNKVRGYVNYHFKNGRFVAKYPNITNYEDHLMVAMASLDELQEMYPEKPRELIVAQRMNARKRVYDDPRFQEWQQSKTKINNK